MHKMSGHTFARSRSRKALPVQDMIRIRWLKYLATPKCDLMEVRHILFMCVQKVAYPQVEPVEIALLVGGFLLVGGCVNR
jgi:hypothetical protein